MCGKSRNKEWEENNNEPRKATKKTTNRLWIRKWHKRWPWEKDARPPILQKVKQALGKAPMETPEDDKHQKEQTSTLIKTRSRL